MKKKIILIIQARLTSSRFPSKVLKRINNKPLIFFLNERLKKCKNIDKIVFAIPNNNKNLKQGVKIAKKYYETEASGNINLKTVKSVAATGVDRISVGSITHSAPAIDLKLEI